jgi:hypothetical protein
VRWIQTSLFDKDVEMDNRSKRVSLLLGGITFLMSNGGCASIPWRVNKPAGTVTTEKDVQQVVDNISYDNSVDFTKDYHSNPESSSTYTPSTKNISAASSKSGSCCSH